MQLYIYTNFSNNNLRRFTGHETDMVYDGVQTDRQVDAQTDRQL